MQHAPEMVGRMIDAVEGLIRRSIAPLADQLRALEAWRESIGQVRGERGEKGEPGIAGRDGARGERGEKGEPGASGHDGVGIRRLDVHAGGKAVDLVLDDGTVATLELPAGPAGTDGRNGVDGRDGARGEKGEKGDRGEKGATGDPGASATLEMVDAAVDKLLPALLAKRLEVELERLLPVIATRAATLVPPGRDGTPGRDGAPGRPGERGDDGRDGRDGVDGLGFDDMHVEPAGERALRLVFEREGQRKTFEIPLSTPLYEGTYQAGRGYQRNDVVTYASSMWIAKQATDEPPKGAGNHWRLVVKGGK